MGDSEKPGPSVTKNIEAELKNIFVPKQLPKERTLQDTAAIYSDDKVLKVTLSAATKSRRQNECFISTSKKKRRIEDGRVIMCKKCSQVRSKETGHTTQYYGEFYCKSSDLIPEDKWLELKRKEHPERGQKAVQKRKATMIKKQSLNI